MKQKQIADDPNGNSKRESAKKSKRSGYVKKATAPHDSVRGLLPLLPFAWNYTWENKPKYLIKQLLGSKLRGKNVRSTYE